MHAAGDEKRSASCLVSLATMAWLSGMQERQPCGDMWASHTGQSPSRCGAGNGRSPRGRRRVLESLSGLPRE